MPSGLMVCGVHKHSQRKTEYVCLVIVWKVDTVHKEAKMETVINVDLAFEFNEII